MRLVVAFIAATIAVALAAEAMPSGRRYWFAAAEAADAGPNPDAAADASCCDASLEGYLSVEAVGFEAVGY